MRRPAGRRALLRRSEIGWAATSAALALVGALWTLRLWRGSLHVPLSYENDGQFYGVLVKEVIHGWYFTNPLLGAPFGSQLFDFPQGGDQLHFVVIKALGLASSDWALVMNVFFLLSFPLCALAAYAVIRRFGASPPSSAVAGALFALLPYHFCQGEFHLFLSAYYAVPLACYLVVATYRGDPLFARRSGRRGGILAWASRRSLITLALCCVVGSADIYYAAFTVVLLAFAGVIVGLTRRSATAPVGALGAAIAIVAVVALNISPTLGYRAAHGNDPQALVRAAAQSKAGSLKPADLVLPLSRHRIAAFGSLRRSYSGPWSAPELASSEGESATLGVLASLGFVGLICVLGATMLGAGVRWDPGGTLRAAAAGALSSFLFATVGGVAIAYVVSPFIRQWVRLSVFIAFFSLLAVALAFDRISAWLRRHRGGRLASALLLGGVGALALLDQTSSELIPPYRALATHYDSDRAFVGSIERRLPPGGEVLQLPYMPWPEPGFVNRMTSFAPVRGYLSASGLRWSYGAMRGRPADWQSQLAGEPPAVVVAAAASAGFDGIYVDRLGYRGASGPSLERALRRLLGVQALVSADRRLAFFDIRPYARRLLRVTPPARIQALREATLRPVRLEPGEGATLPPPPDFPITGAGIHGPVRIRGGGELVAVAPSGPPRMAVFTASVSSRGTAAPVNIRLPGGAVTRFAVGPRPLPICAVLRVGVRSPIRFEAAGLEVLRIDGARLTDVAYAPFGGATCG